ncbi:MAG: site-2 protease family protein [bacterium]
MLGNGVRIGRLFGIKITVDWSWLFIFLLVTWNLVVAFGDWHPEWSLALSVGTGIIASLLFFGSVLAHELAHSLMAIAQDLPVRSITLFLFGGVSNIEREPPSARAEFLIAIVGPITSVVLGGIFLALAAVSGANVLTATTDATELLANLNPLTTLLVWLGPINILLGVFNMIPGFPLDGGRVLRSILWAITNSLQQATRWASYVGQGIAWLLIITGIAMAFGAEVPFFGTGLVGGLWLAFIGWFLNNAASQSYRQVVVQNLLEDVPVGNIMRREPPIVAPSSSVSSLVHDRVMGTDEHAFPVIDNGRLVGLVCLHDVRGVARDRWESTRIAEIMTPREKLQITSPEEEADEALNKMQRGDHRQLPVLEHDSLVGMLRRRDVMRWLQLQSGGDDML